MNKKLLLTALLTCLPFTALAQSAKPKPCSTEQYRHFDFWIGSWEVTGPKGKVVGNSQIKGLLNGCAISEAWSSTNGYQGVSYNFYDNSRKVWHQTWIGGAGGALYLDGGLAGDTMVLQGEKPDKDGTKVLQKISWTPLKDGRVKQHWQTSKDDGKTWQDAFVGFYARKNQ